MFEDEPDFLLNYDPIKAEVELQSQNVKAKLKGLKKYGYSAQEEEKKLNAVLKDVGIKSADTIGKKLSKIGIRNVPEVNEYEDGNAGEL